MGARDPRMMDYTGKVLIPGIMAYGYGFVDERGVRSPPMTSVKALSAQLLRPLLDKLGLWSVPGNCYVETPSVSEAARFFWNVLPDLSLPGKMLKLGAGAPNL